MAQPKIPAKATTIITVAEETQESTKSSEKVLEGQGVDDEADKEGVENGHRCRLRRGKDTAVDTPQYDNWGNQAQKASLKATHSSFRLLKASPVALATEIK